MENKNATHESADYLLGVYTEMHNRLVDTLATARKAWRKRDMRGHITYAMHIVERMDALIDEIGETV